MSIFRPPAAVVPRTPPPPPATTCYRVTFTAACPSCGRDAGFTATTSGVASVECPCEWSWVEQVKRHREAS